MDVFTFTLDHLPFTRVVIVDIDGSHLASRKYPIRPLQPYRLLPLNTSCRHDCRGGLVLAILTQRSSMSSLLSFFTFFFFFGDPFFILASAHGRPYNPEYTWTMPYITNHKHGPASRSKYLALLAIGGSSPQRDLGIQLLHHHVYISFMTIGLQS